MGDDDDFPMVDSYGAQKLEEEEIISNREKYYIQEKNRKLRKLRYT